LPAPGISSAHGISFLCLSLKFCGSASKGFPALGLDLVMVGMMKADPVRRRRQTRTTGLHGDSNAASANLNPLPEQQFSASVALRK
jgi:hypothetical protein